MLDIHGKAKVDRYWTKNSTGEDILVEDISDDLGFYTTRMLAFKDKFANNQLRNTKFYHAERTNNPSSKYHGKTIAGINKPKFGMERTSSIHASFYHENSTGHLKDL